MPSGAKKRKAAKKKKEQEAYGNSNNSSSVDTNNNNNTGTSQGIDDPKSQDERDSDGGEVGSPVSQDQCNIQQPFNDGSEGSENRRPPPIQSPENDLVEGVVRDAEGSQKGELENDSLDKIETGLNSGWAAQGDFTIDHLESTKESHGDDSSSSSCSSSDDESQTLEKKWKHEKVTVSFSEEVAQISENEKQCKGSDENAVVENVTNIDMVPSVLPNSEDLMDLEATEVVKLEFEGNKDKLLPASVEIKVSQAVVVPEKKEDKMVSVLDENAGASSTLVSNANGNEGKVLTSSNACTTETSEDAENIKASENSNGTVIRSEDEILTVRARADEPSYHAENAKYSKTCECTESENQPLVASAPQVAQRTSWLSCCGLFDVFTGSSR